MINYRKILVSLYYLLQLSAVHGEALTPNQSAVASAHPLATAAGIETLQAGGNAFDAAVAVSAALAVVEPYSSGLGGGGFWLIHRAKDGLQTMIDGREIAPRRAHPTMYLDSQGKPIGKQSMNGPTAAAIPGVPAALEHLTKHYGRLTLEKNLEPAIKLARQGFAVTTHYQQMAKLRQDTLNAYPESARIFLLNHDVPPLGHMITQADLANTLLGLAQTGAKYFYQGPLATKLVEGVQQSGGIWTQFDLQDYRIIERQPVSGAYRGAKIISASLPSSGGIVMQEALNILADLDLTQVTDVQRKHLIIESWRRAYRDRALYLGDPNFSTPPIAELLSDRHAQLARQTLQLNQATASQQLSDHPQQESAYNTTHFSIIDQEGNRVAATLSINYAFGSGFTVPGTGILLNDEMDDFVIAPGLPNVYGLIGYEANSIQAGKRPLSSMTPTFIETNDRVAILGTPGGSRIITMVMLGLLDFMDNHDPASWVSVPRFHHQYIPDNVEFEPNALNDIERATLEKMGHHLLESSRRYGNMQAILWDKQQDKVQAASDPRGEGVATVVTLP